MTEKEQLSSNFKVAHYASRITPLMSVSKTSRHLASPRKLSIISDGGYETEGMNR